MNEPLKTAKQMQDDLTEIITLSTEFLKIAGEQGFEVDQAIAESTLEFTVHKGERRITWRVDCDFLSNGPSFGFSWHSTPEYDTKTGNDGYALSIITTDLLRLAKPDISADWEEVPIEGRDTNIPPMVAGCIPEGDDVLWNRKAYRAIFKALLKLEEN